MLDGLPRATIAVERTVRLISTANLRPPVLEGLVPAAMLDDLYEIEGATSGRLNGQWRGQGDVAADEFVYDVPGANYINAAFAYAKSRSMNRFNGEGRGAWYAALEVQTCLAEVTFHLTRELDNIGRYDDQVDYLELHSSFAGDVIDLCQVTGHEALHPDPDVGYPVGNAIAEAARTAGVHLIRYPSVRHAGGTCFAALSPHAVQSVAQGTIWRVRWNGSRIPTIEQFKRAA